MEHQSTPYNFSSNDIKNFKQIYKYLSFFGIVPGKLGTHEKYLFSRSNIYAFFLLILSTAAFGCTFYFKVYSSTEINVSYGVSDLIHNVNDLFTINICLLTTLGKREQWTTLLKWIDYVDKRFSEEYVSTKLPSGWTLYFFVSPFVILAVDIIQIYINAGNVVLYISLYMRLAKYYHFALSFLICMIALIFARRYIALKNIVAGQVRKKPVNIIGMTHLENLSEIRKYYSNLNDAIDNFNGLFGWPFVFLFIGSIIDVIVCINSVMMKSADKSVMLATIIGDVTRSISYIVNIAVLVMACDKIESKASDFINYSYLLQGDLRKSLLREELFYLVRWAKELCPKCSAAGFFSINQVILRTLFSAMLTYMIVFIQLNSS